MERRQLCIVTPVFNDWPSFRLLLGDLDKACSEIDWDVSVVAIDDGSTDENDIGPGDTAHLRHLRGVKILTLATNVGHQRAIAIGLSHAVVETNADAMVVMDSDGEDRPSDIPSLLREVQGQKTFAVVAGRKRRTNSVAFKLFYVLYKAAFSVLTGRNINFGNFSLISRDNARRLVMQAELWNSLPGALLRSRSRITEVSIDRGHRYAGTSKMNYTSLIVHGLSGLSVYSDVIFVRMLAAAATFFVLSAVVIAAVVIVRLTTPELASPGWASTVVFGVSIMLLQIMISTLMTMLLLLSNRSQRTIVPMRDYSDYVLSAKDYLPDHESALEGLRDMQVRMAS
jgi:polyisoprenyl-phosphate glycosyltransferase